MWNKNTRPKRRKPSHRGTKRGREMQREAGRETRDPKGEEVAGWDTSRRGASETEGRRG